MNVVSQSHIIAVYGFLGSGKTTVMLELARCIAARGDQAAIIVNEAGDIPVDGKLLEVSGLPVREIFGGCICCTVVGDFVETLRALKREPLLRYILIEPSGMADAPSLFASIEKHTDCVVSKILILDGPRLPLLLKAAGPIIRNQLDTADCILLNKMDAVPADKAPEVRRLAFQGAADASRFDISATNGLSQQLFNEILK